MLRRLLMLAAIGLLPVQAVAADEPVVWVALSEPGGAYAQAATALRDELMRGGRPLEVRTAPWQELSAGTRAPQVIVALGVAAFRAMVGLQRDGGGMARVPVIAALLPRGAYEAAAPRGPPATSAVFLDQPLGRHLDLLRQTMPQRRKVGVLLGPDSGPLAAALAKAAAGRGLQLISAVVEDEEGLYPALRGVLGEADVLLALPDPRIYNNTTLQNILIASYRQRVPLVGYSPAYVRAGATLALFASPVQAADQAAAMVRNFLGGLGLPPPQPAAEFSVAVNERVARSLGIMPEEPAALVEAIRRVEAGR